MKKQALALAALLVAGSANALTVSYNTSTPIPSTLTDWTSTLAFQKFDSSLGTLQSVMLNLSGSFDTVLTVTNSSTDASSGTAKTEVQISVQDTGNNLNTPQIDAFSSNFGYSLSAGGTTTSGSILKTFSDTQTYTAPSVLALYTGTGNIILNANTFTQSWLTNTGGNTAVSQITNAALDGVITYNYTTAAPIPEADTYAFIALGMGLVGLLARRRKG